MAKTVKYLGGIHNLKVVTETEDGPVYEDDVYNGWDHEKGKDGGFTLGVGDETEVSDTTAAALERKYPGCFAIDGEKAGKRGKRGQSRKAPADDTTDGAGDGDGEGGAGEDA